MTLSSLRAKSLKKDVSDSVKYAIRYITNAIINSKISDMILKKITVHSLGSIDFSSYDLAENLNVLKVRNCDEVSYALRLVLNHKANPPLFPTRADTRIEAIVRIDEKEYLTVLLPNAENDTLILKVYDDNGKDVTTEYIYLCSHCAEHDLSDIFDGNEDTMLLRFLQYANEDQYYAPRELAKQTEGISTLRAFRLYLRTFIKNFKGETIREGKHYEIVLKPNGRYAVKHRIDGDLPVLLSESERTLFRYLCFLRTAEFWRGFEDIRNLHGIKKPLIIKDFLNRLDESIDVKDLLRRTGELGRQVIILS